MVLTLAGKEYVFFKAPVHTDQASKRPQVRIAAAISTVCTVLLAYAIILIELHQPDLTDKLTKIITGLNGLSLFLACVLMCEGWVLSDTINWFNERFLLDSASFAADSVIFVAAAIPGYFTKSVLTIPSLGLYLVLVVSRFVHWVHLYGAALKQKPGCYDEQMLTDCWIFACINFAGVVVTSLLLGIYNRENLRQDDIEQGESSTPKAFAPIKLIILAPTTTTCLELYWVFSDYNYLRPLLSAPEHNWTFGQTMPLAMIIGGILYSFWTMFKVDGMYYIFFHEPTPN
jgi:hypothetical protein